MPPARLLLWLGAALLAFARPKDAVKITDIQGASFQSPYAGQEVHGVVGVITGKDRYGVWIQGERSTDPRVSNGLRLYTASLGGSVSVGDEIVVSGRVAEYRASDDDLFLTELDYVSHMSVLSHGNAVAPVVLGVDRIPPTGQLSPLDNGRDGWLSVPNNVTRLESVNATLQPDVFGLDFWESLEGQLVTVVSPTATGFPDWHGNTWVYGDWPTTGKNERGGLTISVGANDGTAPAHPEAVLIGRPLDDTRLPKSTMGMTLSNITGILTYQFGSYILLPLTAPTVVDAPDTEASPSALRDANDACQLRIGDYNVENMGPRSHHISDIADHIVNYLHSPDIVFVQEIQDDSGSKDNGVVTANKTLSALVAAISKASDGEAEYEFVNVAPEDNKDGGKPGGNIRVAYLWKPERVTLVPGSVSGNATTATEVVVDGADLNLSYNPGRIDPLNDAWIEARKPLAAAWQTTTGDRFFTVNVHFSSKRDGSSAQGDARPPVNGGVERRIAQVNTTATFINSILALAPDASVVVAGDMNEYLATRAVFRPFLALLTDINEAAGVPPTERYTYVYEQHTQEIDHMFVSEAIARRGAEVEHVHVNTWARTVGERASDHDPTVARMWVCDGERGVQRNNGLVDQVGSEYGF